MRATIACALLLTACGPNVRIGGNYGNTGCPSGMDGILLIDWTVRGLLPSTQSCSGISKLTLFLSGGLCGEVQIEPISCALDKFRYDMLPDGQSEIVLQGVDSHDALQVSGSATVTLTPTLPTKPTTIALH